MTPYVKYYLENRTKQVSNLWDDIDGNKKGSIEQKELFGFKVFDNPKPVALVEKILKIASRKNSIVLDFFAGSGTTAQAVIKQNIADGGSRSFIIVQINEDIAEGQEAYKNGYRKISEVTRARIEKFGEKVSKSLMDKVSPHDLGFRMFRVDTSNFENVRYSPDETSQTDLVGLIDNIKESRSPEDLLFQVLIDWGVDLTLPIRRATIHGKTVFFVDDNALAACFDSGVTEDLVKELAGHVPLRMVFRDNGFVSDAVKINVEQIFRQLSPNTDIKSI